jgi:hypothetical protein
VEVHGFVAGVVEVDWFLISFVGWHCLVFDRWFAGLVEGTLFVELVKVVGDWLVRNDRIGNKLELGLGYLGEFGMGRAKDKMESIDGEADPLLWVVHFPGRWLLWELLGVLLHLSFRLEENRAIFCVVVGFTTIVHSVRRLECVLASVATVAPDGHAASLIVLIWPMIEGLLTSFLWGWSKILLLVFQRSTTIGIDVVHLLGVAALIIIVSGWPWGFIMPRCFSVLFPLAKVQNLWLTKLCELFIKLCNCFLAVPWPNDYVRVQRAEPW